jgi:repressor LexA
MYIIGALREGLRRAAFHPVREQPVADNGEIVAAAVTSGCETEATVKTLQHANGHVWLMPQNPRYAPIPADGAIIFGKVVAVLRGVDYQKLHYLQP